MSNVLNFNEGNFNRRLAIDSSGILGGDDGAEGYKVRGETQIRVSTTSLAPANVVEVQVKLLNEDTWTALGTINGNTSTTFDITTWDQIRFDCSTYSGSAGTLAVSAFFFRLSSSSGSTDPAVESGVVIENVPCDATVYVNAAVRMSGGGVAFNALADSVANSAVLGICISKQSATECTIRVSGKTNSIFVGLDPTMEYFLSDTVAGAITTTIPTDPGHIVLRLGQPFSTTEFVIDKATRMVRD